MPYRLYRRQLVGGSLDAVFAFFTDPRNLEAITPPWMGFRILNSSDEVVRRGTRIRYRLKVNGVPIGWESLIAEYREGEMFADKMVVGPYRRWYHQHSFRPLAGGVEIIDQVDYELPLGPLGRLAHSLFVRRQLEAIFAHRRHEIARRFPPLQPRPQPEVVTA